MNPLLNSINSGPVQPQPAPQSSGNPQLLQQIRANPRAFVGQIKADPVGFLRRCGYNLPVGMSANPQQIAQYLFGARR